MNLSEEDQVVRSTGPSHFGLEPWDRMAHYPGDAKPNDCLRSDLPGAVCASDSCSPYYALLKRCGVRRRCPPVVTAWELIQSLVFHVVAGAGTLAQHVKPLTGKQITDGALAQRRALLPITVFEQLLDAMMG